MKSLIMVGSTHFDPVWLWTWDEARASIRSTFHSALERMKEEPLFECSFSCPPVFEWIRQCEPDMFDEIKARVREGRWHLDEALWLQPDTYCADGESYVRQCLHGQRYLLEHFGRLSDTAFNTDSFGHSAFLPAIYSGARIKYCVICRPSSADLRLSDPLFRWESPDGSSVLCYRAEDEFGAWSRRIEHEMDTAERRSGELCHPLMLLYGVTDHGGAPTKADIAAIKARSERSDVRFGGVTDFFESLGDFEPNVISRELPISSFGSYCNLPDIKQSNKRAEYSLFNAEKASVFAALVSDLPYPAEKLRESCRDMLFNQFHDTLGGTIISDAALDTRDLYGRSIADSSDALHLALQSLTKKIHLPPSPEYPWSVAAFNLEPRDFSGVMEAEVQWAWEFDFYSGDIALSDADGIEYPCQLCSARSAIPGFRSRFLFKAEIPALGYKTFRVMRRKSEVTVSDIVSVSERKLENEALIADIDGYGLRSLYNKRGGKAIAPVGTPMVFDDDSDVWAFNFTGYGEAHGFEPRSVEIIENGPVRGRIRVTSAFGDSIISQDFLLESGSDTLECRVKVNWNERQKTLKLRFGDADNGGVTASTPFGFVVRERDGADRPVGEWLETDGFNIALKGMFSYSANRDSCCLNVLRSPVTGDLRIAPLSSDEDYTYLSQGITDAAWSIGFGKHSERRMSLNNPPISVVEAGHIGTLPMSMRLASLSQPSAVTLTALKQAEDGSGDICVRLRNVTGVEQQTSFALYGCEELNAELKPFEIKTFRLGHRWYETDLLEIRRS